MYKLLIADDDEIICRGLAECIDWKKLDVQVAGTANDGEMALEKVRSQPPDIAIVDINMPFMDGMEFASIVRQDFPWIKIIILTAYREFQYAQKAVQMQVFGYLTKPFSNQEVEEIVGKAISSLAVEREYQEEVRKNLAVIRERYLAELTLHGALDEQDRKILPIQSPSSSFQAAVLYLRRLKENADSITETLVEEEVALHMVSQQIREYIQSYENVGMFQQNNRLVFVCEYAEEEAMAADLMTAGALARELMALLSEEDYVYAVCGIGGTYKGMEQIPYSYEEAGEAVENRYDYGNQSIIYFSGLKEDSGECNLQFHAISDHIQRAIKKKDRKELQEQIEQLIRNIENVPRINQYSLGFMLMELLLLAYKAAEDEDLYRDFFKGSGNLMGRILKSRGREETADIIWSSFGSMFQHLEKKKTSESERIVRRAVEYMKEHHTDPDMNFKDVAESVHLSTSYLSALLKKHGNINYNHFLTQMRIEHAKELLCRPDVKSYEAAFMAGFNSSQYFSSCFKKATGLTPREYKERQNGN